MCFRASSLNSLLCYKFDSSSGSLTGSISSAIGMVFITALALCAAIYAIRCIYVAFFKLEISSVPGPFLAKFTDLYSLFQAYKSTRTRWLQDLHRQHGSLVRIAPNRFSVSDPKALSDIYDLKHEYPKSDQMETLNTVINGRINQGLVPTVSAVH